MVENLTEPNSLESPSGRRNLIVVRETRLIDPYQKEYSGTSGEKEEETTLVVS